MQKKSIHILGSEVPLVPIEQFIKTVEEREKVRVFVKPAVKEAPCYRSVYPKRLSDQRRLSDLYSRLRPLLPINQWEVIRNDGTPVVNRKGTIGGLRASYTTQPVDVDIAVLTTEKLQSLK